MTTSDGLCIESTIISNSVHYCIWKNTVQICSLFQPGKYTPVTASDVSGKQKKLPKEYFLYAVNHYILTLTQGNHTSIVTIGVDYYYSAVTSKLSSSRLKKNIRTNQ